MTGEGEAREVTGERSESGAPLASPVPKPHEQGEWVGGSRRR